MPKINLDETAKIKKPKSEVQLDYKKDMVEIKHKNYKMTPHVLRLLEVAFLNGHTDEEACLMAGIHTATLYRYIKVNPDFEERKNLLKNNPIIKARQTLNKAIETNPDIALKFLERKKRDEFGIKAEVDITSQGNRIVSFNYLPPAEITGELIDESNNKTNEETTSSFSDTSGQDY